MTNFADIQNRLNGDNRLTLEDYKALNEQLLTFINQEDDSIWHKEQIITALARGIRNLDEQDRLPAFQSVITNKTFGFSFDPITDGGKKLRVNSDIIKNKGRFILHALHYIPSAQRAEAVEFAFTNHFENFDAGINKFRNLQMSLASSAIPLIPTENQESLWTKIFFSKEMHHSHNVNAQDFGIFALTHYPKALKSVFAAVTNTDVTVFVCPQGTISEKFGMVFDIRGIRNFSVSEVVAGAPHNKPGGNDFRLEDLQKKCARAGKDASMRLAYVFEIFRSRLHSSETPAKIQRTLDQLINELAPRGISDEQRERFEQEIPVVTAALDEPAA